MVAVGQLALVVAAVFTGAAIYINVAEQPACLQLDNRSVLAEWKPAYKRGYVMQASLAILGGVFELVAYFSASFNQQTAAQPGSSTLPTLGVHVMMGSGAEKMANHRANLERGVVAPNEIVARAPRR